MFTGNKKFDTKFGRFSVDYQEGVITGIKIDDNDDLPPISSDEEKSILEKQIIEYLNGDRKSFTVMIKLTGTPFERKVFTTVIQIPYGETISYKELAKRLGKPNGARAVGNALNKNQLPILVPCHRVVGQDGDLKGYKYGLAKKEYLLDLERKNKS
ncbi:MAG: methylated-DNA--[protein]-cysteine S-methyltransferase [Tissierellia bacterium]|nr:methylated-DNA--[protein]-cysteine S-methyltransferase [Tissierellia bacterium]